jgi:hypothetical protein
MKVTMSGTDSKTMRYEDEVVDLGKGCPVWGDPAADGDVHVQAFKSRGPRPKPRRQGIGRALRRVAVVLMILIPLVLWISNVVVSSPASTALAHY